MRVIICAPELSMEKTANADIFFEACRKLLSEYETNVVYIESVSTLTRIIEEDREENDILIFFNSENGNYDRCPNVIKLIERCHEAKCHIWPIAMDRNPNCRKPPEPVSRCQSFDFYCREDENTPFYNNIEAIAHVFVRKIISQTQSPLYRNEVLYFISHRRLDGEELAANLAKELRALTRKIDVYRDVICVEVGDDAQRDIDENLKISDLVIFLQTPMSDDSDYIMKELSYAIINNIPVLWIQIDGASYDKLKIRPGDKPVLTYSSSDLSDPDQLRRIAREVEDNAFRMIMLSSEKIYTYIDCIREIERQDRIKIEQDKNNPLSYEISYEQARRNFGYGTHRNYIQCYGRNPQDDDCSNFVDNIKSSGSYCRSDRLFLLSCHGKKRCIGDDEKIWEENIEDYIDGLLYEVSGEVKRKHKRIILSGAFPDCDELYKYSLLEAVVTYAKQIIKNGYTLVFGAHPTFQDIIFDMGKTYSDDVQYSIEMHMSKEYISRYDVASLEKCCKLVLSDNLSSMRHKMICEREAAMLICLGGKIKKNKSEQGVDIEVELAKAAGIPVALVGTVGGRSGQLAYEMYESKTWSELNSWGNELNEALFHNVNHRLMITRLLNTLSNEIN